MKYGVYLNLLSTSMNGKYSDLFLASSMYYVNVNVNKNDNLIKYAKLSQFLCTGVL